MLQTKELAGATLRVAALNVAQIVGRIVKIDGGTIFAGGLGGRARIGDRVSIHLSSGDQLTGEIVKLLPEGAVVMPDGPLNGAALGDRIYLKGPAQIAPDDSWIGRIIDPDGDALDGWPLAQGVFPRSLHGTPPPAAQRNPLGGRLETGLAVFNTLLPIVEGQRIGLFAGSGVGKSSLLGELAQKMQADVVVLAMVGERGRELRHFVDHVLGPEGLARSVVVAATSDQSPLKRRRCAWTAMSVAEYFRDQGKSVLLLTDSITRFAEAHREIAIAAGEAPVLRGYPPSTAHLIMSLCERAGPGGPDQGHITGVFSVLVAGSDMNEPIADILRGVLDGHVVLDRDIAERGRFPAIDVLQSVSRSLPEAATLEENEIIKIIRRALGTYDRNAMMITAGLYSHGSDPDIDTAIALWPQIEEFLTKHETKNTQNSFNQLILILRRAKVPTRRGSSPAQ